MMTRSMQETHYELARRELLAIDAACDHLLKCESGELWITEEGPRDIILGPGESYRAEGAAAVVVSALKASVLAVTHPPATSIG